MSSDQLSINQRRSNLIEWPRNSETQTFGPSNRINKTPEYYFPHYGRKKYSKFCNISKMCDKKFWSWSILQEKFWASILVITILGEIFLVFELGGWK